MNNNTDKYKVTEHQARQAIARRIAARMLNAIGHEDAFKVAAAMTEARDAHQRYLRMVDRTVDAAMDRLNGTEIRDTAAFAKTQAEAEAVYTKMAQPKTW